MIRDTGDDGEAEGSVDGGGVEVGACGQLEGVEVGELALRGVLYCYRCT